MNNTFDLQRFGLLLKRQWLEFGKIYLILLGVALGILIAFYGFGLWDFLFYKAKFSIRAAGFREPLFLIFGFLFISVIASSYFAHLGQKPKAIIDLLIPASTFEKFLAGVVFTALLSISSFLLLFYLTDLAFVSRINGLYEGSSGKTEMQYFFSRNWENGFMPIFSMPLLVTSVFLLGSVYFNRFHYIKTAITVMIFAGIWSYITFKSAKVLFDGRIPVELEQAEPFSERQTEFLLLLLVMALTTICWAITYVRLKEKEV